MQIRSSKDHQELHSVDIFAIAMIWSYFSNLVFGHFSVNSFKVRLNDFDVIENPKIRVVIIQLIMPRLLPKNKYFFLFFLACFG